MSGTYIRYPFLNSISVYPSAANFPVTNANGALVLALDTDTLYVFNTGSMTYVAIATPGAAIAIDGLTGDVSATGPGVVPATVNSVGGSSAVNINLATIAANAATDSNTPNTIVKRDGSGNFAAGTITASLTGHASLDVATASLGNLTDAGTDGIVVTGGTGAVVGSVSLAQTKSDATHNGYLSSTDWSTFNSKQAALTFGNLTDVGTDGITVSGGTGAVIGSGTSISQHVADATHNGYLSSTDWSTFNSKQETVTIGALDAQAANATGLALVSNVLSTQSADATHPGMVNTTTQSFAGNKTFTGTISASNLSGTNTGDVTLAAFGSTPSANGASLSGQVLTLQPADNTHPGGVSILAQTFAGVKTFSSAPNFSSLTASTALVLDGSNNVASLAYGSATAASTLVQRDSNGDFVARSFRTVDYIDDFTHRSFYLGNAGNRTATGTDDTGVGDTALLALTSGIKNTAIGSAALSSNLTGSNNTAVGFNTLHNVTGDNNTSVGKDSGLQNTSGARNTYIGVLTGNTNQTGSDNSAFGYQSLALNTASNNVASGPYSLENNTTGTQNTGIGNSTLDSLTTGNNDTALGYQAGYNSGTPLQTIANSTFLGAFSNASTDGITNSTAVGYQAQVTASNQIMLGNASVTSVKSGTPSALYNGSSPMTTTGDMEYYSAGVQRLPIGTASYLLQSVGGIPAWTANTSSILTNSSTVSGTTVTDALNTIGGNFNEVYLAAIKNAGSVTANTEIGTWTTVTKDTNSAFNASSGTFTVPVAGDYQVRFTAATTAGTPLAQVYYNGALVQTGTGSGVRTSVMFSVSNAAVNDTIWVALDSTLTLTSTATDTTLNIVKIVGPGTGPVNMRYNGATATVTSSASAVSYTSSNFDTASAYSGSTYTVPSAGKYLVMASLSLTAATVAAANTQIIYVYQNGAEVKRSIWISSGATAKPAHIEIHDLLSCALNDTIQIFCSSNSTTPTVQATATLNVLSIAKLSI